MMELIDNIPIYMRTHSLKSKFEQNTKDHIYSCNFEKLGRNFLRWILKNQLISLVISVVITILLQSSILRHGLEIYFTFNNQFLRFLVLMNEERFILRVKRFYQLKSLQKISLILKVKIKLH